MDKWAMIAERKRQRKRERSSVHQVAKHVYRSCGICDQPYVANNYDDSRVRVKRWHGLEVCAHCQYKVLKYLPRLMEAGIVRFTKDHKPSKLA